MPTRSSSPTCLPRANAALLAARPGRLLVGRVTDDVAPFTWQDGAGSAAYDPDHVHRTTEHRAAHLPDGLRAAERDLVRALAERRSG